MELKRHEQRLRAPKIGLLDSAGFSIPGSDIFYPLVYVELERIWIQRREPKTKDVVGLPRMIAHDSANDYFEFWPAPEFDLNVHIEYFPPRERL